MILSFSCRDTALLFDSQDVPRFRNIERVARRKLLMLNAATMLETLRVPPGNRLEPLSGDLRGFYSLRINIQWRLCFRWTGEGAVDVAIVDYH